ncbi:IclR family transcriptional regulator [uncultured Megasphaera sp.]|uniref:IclR family transcriptional regulator n=1 Tax=uncultured Megasphaera sp. TaxID=165188 RepID=UPI00266BA6EF|nr:IclR family transcriptional regulator [uncultured Megasphaera sp.]
MKDSKLHNPTLRVLNILETVCANNKGLTLTAISNQTGIAKGTLYPIVMTLIHERYLQIHDASITIGQQCFKLGNAYGHSLNYLSIIRPYMQNIVNQCDEICQLGILDGPDVLYIEKTEPDQAIRITSYVGKTLAASATALGKVLLSGLSEERIRKLYTDGLTRYTEKTTSDIETLLSQVKTAREKGYAHEIGESHIEVECLAVPIRRGTDILAAISVSLPIFRSTPEKTKDIVSLLKQQVHLIEHEINQMPSKQISI